MVEPEKAHLTRDGLLILLQIRFGAIAAFAAELESVLVAALATLREVVEATAEIGAGIALSVAPRCLEIVGDQVRVDGAAVLDAGGQIGVCLVALGRHEARESRSGGEEGCVQHGGRMQRVSM